MDGDKIIDIAIGLAIVLAACVAMCSPYSVTVDGVRHEIAVGCGGCGPSGSDTPRTRPAAETE